jgi:hypothetical protein
VATRGSPGDTLEDVEAESLFTVSAHRRSDRILCIGRTRCRHTAELQFPAERVDHAQRFLQAQGGLSRLQVDDEAHAHTRGQCQLRLRQPELPACSPEGAAELAG